MNRIGTRSIRSGVHHPNPYTTEDLVTNSCLIEIYNPNPHLIYSLVYDSLSYVIITQNKGK